ncbi:MAG: PASTA domain-containing protein [Kineosporiaceae bacterium]|nr:PASTA domain-containing protein [Kineosporiaceae bacterium]
MHGDFSRRTFDAADHYRAVLLQQGRVLLDADVNEQADITTHHDEVRTRDIVGRSGGPAPSGDEPGPFAIVGPSATAANRWRFRDEAWTALRLTPGRYSVDGVLAESDGAPAGGWPLARQPYLPPISEAERTGGLAEPSTDGRYAAYLDVWQRQVTFDDDPLLLESALGGPDTTTRSQTVWQVRLEPIANNAVRCSDLHALAAAGRTARRLVASLAEPEDEANPCEISATGGYQRLENQLYRVQVHHEPDPTAPQPQPGTFLFSRDNGSVVAGIAELTLDGATAVLTLDRLGRDDELSFREGQLVEVTSADRELRGLPGFLAHTAAPTGADLPITWLGTPPVAPAEEAELGSHPIVRRWEGGPIPIGAAAVDLEDGIQVAFPAGGTLRTGDHWLIPARTVREVYGLTALSGTIEWPTTADVPPVPLPQPPVGPQHHLTPLAILSRSGGTWSLESDCRLLFPALTELVAIDEVGGDGQEAMPGDPLPEPLRVAVRSGGRPVVGARVQFTASHGGVLSAESRTPAPGGPSVLVVGTDAAGVADVRWMLAPGTPVRPNPATQRVTARRLDDHDQPIDAAVIFTGRLSIASQVAWQPPDCARFAGTRTVQQALEAIIDRRELRLLGGDGQVVRERGTVVPRPVRVVLDDGCGPVEKVLVIAKPESGRVAGAVEGEPTPDSLEGRPGVDDAVPTGPDGVASFWWQPQEFDEAGTAVLDLLLDGAGEASIRVTAQLDPPGGGGSNLTEGLNIHRLVFRTPNPTTFENDDTIGANELATGIQVVLDGPVVPDTVQGKPVVRVELDLPWPIGADGDAWKSPVPIGTQRVTLDATLDVSRDSIIWTPQEGTSTWLTQVLFELLEPMGLKTITGWFVLEGWAIVAQKNPRWHVNCHANTVVVNASQRTLIDLPTDDTVAGGQFLQWFRLQRVVERQRRDVPPVVGRTAAVAQRELETAGFRVSVVTAPDPLVRKGIVIRTVPEPGTSLAPASTVEVVVSSGRL